MPMPGRSSVDRYELRERLGTGGMGTVWHAWDPSLQRDVAVKEVVLPDDMDPDELSEMRARTLREAQATARIKHTAVVTIHDVLDHDASPWIVMELLTGTSLQTLLDRSGPMPVGQVEDTAKALLGGLKAAHGVGVTHRDIKPANVMRTDDDRTILTDFGIANMDGNTALTQTGVYIGSPEYMAPERFEGERALPASDMWSLGVTLYTLLQGQSPFKRDSITGIISAVLTAPVPPELSAPGGTGDPATAPLRTLIGALLTRELAQRPGPAQALEVLARAKQAPGGPSGGQRPAPYPSGPQIPVSGPQAAASGPQAPAPPPPGQQPGAVPAPQRASTPHPNAPGQPGLGQPGLAQPGLSQPGLGHGGVAPQGHTGYQGAPHRPSGPHTAPASGPQAAGAGTHPAQINNEETSGTGFVRGIHRTGYHQFSTAQPAAAPQAATGQFTPGQPVASPPAANQPSWRRAKPDMPKPASVVTAAVMLGINALYLMVLTALFITDVIDDGGIEWSNVLFAGAWGLVSAVAAVGLMTQSRLLYGLVLIVQIAASTMLLFSMFWVLVYAPIQLPLYLLVLVFNLTIAALLLIPAKARAFFGFGANFQ